MPTEAEFEAYKEQLKKDGVKQARKTATVFSILTSIALISLVYAFFQNAVAVRAQIHAEEQAAECIKNQKDLEIKSRKVIEELERDTKMLEATYQNAVKSIPNKK